MSTYVVLGLEVRHACGRVRICDACEHDVLYPSLLCSIDKGLAPLLLPFGSSREGFRQEERSLDACERSFQRGLVVQVGLDCFGAAIGELFRCGRVWVAGEEADVKAGCLRRSEERIDGGSALLARGSKNEDGGGHCEYESECVWTWV